MILPYDASKEERDKIVAERERKLFQSFEKMREKVDEQIQGMNMSTVSERARRQQLEEIRQNLQEQLQAHYNALESGLKDDMVDIGGKVLNESESFYKGLQMPIAASITSFPVEIMNNIVNGSVYQEKWYLSKALWGDYTEKLDQINEVITQGVGLNLSSLEIAKQLEQYVDPNAMSPSKTIVTHCLQDPVTGKMYSMDYVKRHPEKNWYGFKEKNSYFRYGKVDYNAQRLARTLISHAYQQNVVHQAKANPFSTGVKWLASGGERMCEICEERDGKIFPADDVPLDHPNGMCTFEVVTDLNMMEMSNVLADFVNGVPTDYDDKLYGWYNDKAVKPEQKPVGEIGVTKDDDGFKKYWAKVYKDKSSGSKKKSKEASEIYAAVKNEFGALNEESRLAYYNKYVLGIAGLDSGIMQNDRVVFEQFTVQDFEGVEQYWTKRLEKERFDFIKNETGFGDDKTRSVLHALCGDSVQYDKYGDSPCWFYGADTKIRNLDGAKWEKAAADIDDYIVAARKYGGAIYRGIVLDKKQFSELSVGGTFLEKGSISSWSSSEDLALNFADVHEDGMFGVLLRTEAHPYAAPVANLSIFGNDEDEVIVSNLHENKYKISGIEYSQDGIAVVTLGFGG